MRVCLTEQAKYRALKSPLCQTNISLCLTGEALLNVLECALKTHISCFNSKEVNSSNVVSCHINLEMLLHVCNFKQSESHDKFFFISPYMYNVCFASSF